MIWVLSAILAVVAGVLGLNAWLPGLLGSQDAQNQFAYGLTLTFLIFSSIALISRLRVKEILKTSLTWLAIFLALTVFYQYRDGFRQLGQQMVLAVDPAVPQSVGGEVRIRASDGGHFLANAEVEGKRVRFLVDTGASSVVLTSDDAKRLGIRVDNLVYSVEVATANGRSFVAPIRIKSISLGTIHVEDVPAAVARDGLDTSLLGMSFLRRLTVQFDKDGLVLKR